MKVLFETQNFQIFILTIGGKYIPKLKLYSLRSSTKARKQQKKILMDILFIFTSENEM
jgi:hypothetical protein